MFIHSLQSKWKHKNEAEVATNSSNEIISLNEIELKTKTTNRIT